MPLDVGSITATLGFKAEGNDQIAQWKRQRDEAEQKARQPVEQRLGFDVDTAALERYRAELAKVKAQAGRRKEFEVKLGADFDESAFRSFERATDKAERDALKARAATKGFGEELHGLTIPL